jgi:flagellar hook assembly protein FlgD
MAQFSNLQATQAMQTDLSTGNASTQANALLGKNVTLQVNSTTTAQGVVSAVDLSSGTPQLVVNGQDYNLSQVLTITPSTTP